MIKLINHATKKIISLVLVIAIFCYYFHLSYVVPMLSDDHTFFMLRHLSFDSFMSELVKNFAWNDRIGETLYKVLSHFSVPIFLVIPVLHMANILVIFYITSGKKLNPFSLKEVKDFVVLFILYTFLNSMPFEGIVWQAGTLSNNTGFLFLVLFFLYIKKIILTDNLQKNTHIWGLVSAVLVGWALETVPVHIMASFVFIIIYLYYKKENIITFFLSKKMLLIAYFTTFISYVCAAITANFWLWRRKGFSNNITWNLFDNFEPIPFINQFLFWFLLVATLVYFLIEQKLSSDFKKKNKQKFVLISFLIVLNFLTLAINYSYTDPRAFFYQSFIAISILFYIYLTFKPYVKPALKKAIYIAIICFGLLCAIYLTYQVHSERYRYDTLAKYLTTKKGKDIVYIPKSSTITFKPFINLATIIEIVLPSKISKSLTAGRFTMFNMNWEQDYNYKYYGIKKVRLYTAKIYK